jgi:2-polyprenyl-3-methyl-5-hydroxy-6-metoxy-1,4-benzoquinol methylase
MNPIESVNLLWKAVDSFVSNSTSPALTYYRPCPVCGTVQSRVVTQLTHFQFYTDSVARPKRVNVVVCQCLQCYAIFLNPCYSQYGFAMLFAEAGQSYGTQRGPEQIQWLHSHGLLEPGQCVLDAGCYDGRFLSLIPPEIAKVGVDIDAPAIEVGRAKYGSQGIEFILGDFESFQCRQAPDVITMFHVLEHLPRPVDVLRNLRRSSKAKTRLVLEGPIMENGFTNDINGFFSIQHMTHFTRRSLRNTFACAGWNIAEWFELSDYGACRIIATPGPEASTATGDPADMTKVQRYLSHWYKVLADVSDKLVVLQSVPRCVIWGGGAHTEFLYQTTNFFHSKPDRLYVIVDSDPLKHGRTWRGVPIYGPAVLRNLDWSATHLLISSYGSQNTIDDIASHEGVPTGCIVRLYDQIRAY